MKIRTGLLTNEYKDETTFQWPEGSGSQAGGGVLDGIGSLVFFEVFIKGMTYIRGEGQTLIEAEKAAWDKYQVYISCEHEFERFSATSQLGKCKHCSMKKEKMFKMLTTCNSCGKHEVMHNIGHEYYCYEHYMEKLVDNIKTCDDNRELIAQEKWLACHQVLEEADAFAGLSDVDIHAVFHKNYHGFFEYMVDVCKNLQKDFNPTSKVHYIDVLEMIEHDKETLKAIFNVYLYECKGIKVNKDMKHLETLLIEFVKSK